MNVGFKKRVLLSSQKELQQKTDIAFEFEEIRERRRVVRLDFKIISQHKNPKTVSNSLEVRDTLAEQLKTKIFLNQRQIQTVLKQFEENQIKRNIDYVLAQNNIKNLAGYFMKALELDYGQTLFIQQEQKAKEKLLVTQKLQEKQKQKQLKAQSIKAKKEKIEEFIRDREEEVLELIPSFIKANQFLLQQSKIDLGDSKEFLKIIQ